jgi:two-component system, NarL family, sensor kinase
MKGSFIAIVLLSALSVSAQRVPPGPASVDLHAYFAYCRSIRNTSVDSLCKYARLARKLAGPDDSLLAGYYCADCLLFEGRLDSARALIASLKVDSVKQAYIYGLLGQADVTALIRQERYKDAVAASLHYLSIATAAGDTLGLIIYKTYIGIAHMRLLQKPEALSWYRDGLSTSDNPRFYREYPQIYGNLGILLATMGRWDSAEWYTSRAIRIEMDSGNLSGLAAVLPARGVLFMETARQKEAGPVFQSSLTNARSLNDPYMTMAALIANATYDRATKKYAESISMSKEAIDLGLRNHIRSQLPYIYTTLAEDYRLEGDYKDYAAALEEYMAVKDSLTRKNSEEALADLQMKYAVQQKENTILRQNLEIGRKNLWIVWGFILSATIVLFSVVLFRVNRNRQRMKMTLLQKEEQFKAEQAVKDAEDKERRRVAAELHDDMGTRITLLSHSASQLMDTAPDLGRQIKNATTELMQSLRETVWALKQETLFSSDVWIRYKNFAVKLHQAYPDVKLDLREESGCPERQLSYIDALNLLRILQEATSNAFKHSGGSRLVAEVSGRGLVFRISDNGKGFLPQEIPVEGNGIPNMRERATQSHFGFVLDAAPGRGTNIEVMLIQ